VRVAIVASEDAFLERLLLRLGPDAEVLDPPAAETLRRDAALRLLRRYES
jgi:predicted DNA-binding transcriptional regulator YafY